MSEDDSTRPRRRRGRRHPAGASAAPPTTRDAIDTAMQAERHDASPDSPARQLLIKQAQLLDRQAASETMSFLLKCLTGLVGLVVAAALGSLVWSASNERGLVIEPFSVPPEFARRGITGQVLASRLLDHLSEMGEQTVSVRAPSSYANNWNGDIKVQIPQTGVSVGELRRYLVEWLGHQTTIGGELYQTPQGLVLDARTGTAAASTHTGASEADLERMIADAAESVYATTQPYRHAIYLSRTGGDAGVRKAKAALLQLTESGDDADRMWAYAALNLHYQSEGDFQAAIRAADEAIAIAPEFNLAYANRAGALESIGHSEAAYHDTVMAERLARSDGERFMTGDALKFVNASWHALNAGTVGDFNEALPAQRRALHARPGDANSIARLFSYELGLHDVAAAQQLVPTIPRPAAGADARELASFAEDMAGLAAQIDIEREQWAQAARRILSVDESRLSAGEQVIRRSGMHAWGALALAKSGELARAQALIDTTPTDCYLCTWVRGAIAQSAGRAAESDRWFADALRQGPSLPQAELAWGRAKLERKDLDGAIALFEQAHAKGPHWADPLKFEGDAFAGKQDFRAAERNYARAAEFAPRWGALQQAWGEALLRLGRPGDAAIHLRAAAGLG